MAYPTIDINRLTVGERLQLIDQVWDSLRHVPGVLPLSDAERAMIETRRTEHRNEPATAVEWNDVRTELLSDQEADEQQAKSSKRR